MIAGSRDHQFTVHHWLSQIYGIWLWQLREWRLEKSWWLSHSGKEGGFRVLVLWRTKKVPPFPIRSQPIKILRLRPFNNSWSKTPWLGRELPQVLSVWQSDCLSVYPSVCPFVCQSVSLSVCRSVCLSVGLSVCVTNHHRVPIVTFDPIVPLSYHRRR